MLPAFENFGNMSLIRKMIQKTNAQTINLVICLTVKVKAPASVYQLKCYQYHKLFVSKLFAIFPLAECTVFHIQCKNKDTLIWRHIGTR